MAPVGFVVVVERSRRTHGDRLDVHVAAGCDGSGGGKWTECTRDEGAQ